MIDYYETFYLFIRSRPKTKSLLFKLKVLIIVLLSIFFVLMIGSFIVLPQIGNEVNNKLRPEMISNFEPWSKNGFVVFSDYESQFLFYPNGELVNLRKNNTVRELVGVSKNKILTFQQSGPYKSTKTKLVISDWYLNDEKPLLVFNGDYYFDTLVDGKVLIYYYSMERNGYLVDIETGTVESVPTSYQIIKSRDQEGKIMKEDNGYLVSMPLDENIYFENDAIDTKLRDLIYKWNFLPARCRRLINGNYCCSFHRDDGFWGFWAFPHGTKAYLLMELNKNKEVECFQFIEAKSSYQTGNWPFEIRNKLAESYDNKTMNTNGFLMV